MAIVAALHLTAVGAPALAADLPPPNIHMLPARHTPAQEFAAGFLGGIRRTTNMTYHGGVVQHAVTVYTVFWDPNGTMTQNYKDLVNRYFQDVGGTPFYGVNTQYYDNLHGSNTPMQNASSVGGTWTDTAAYPRAGTVTAPLFDSDIAAEVDRAQQQNGWPAPVVTASGAGIIYFVFTARGIESCADNTYNECTVGVTLPPTSHRSQYCAYHSWEGGAGSKIYAYLPYVETWGGSCRDFSTSPNGNIAADAEIAIASHEHFEAATDPYGDAWYDTAVNGEDGDKCAFVYGSNDNEGDTNAKGFVQPDGHNLVLNGHRYIIQLEWSNADLDPSKPLSGCVSGKSISATDIPNPDAYACSQSGYVDFEGFPNGTTLSSQAIGGMQFTTASGFTWLVGDFATGLYNGKYPAGGYTSGGTHWAWPATSQGRIDFTDGPATSFSLLASDVSPLALDAYDESDNLIGTAGPAASNYGTGHMSELKITSAQGIAYVIVRDGGNFFAIDDVCTDAAIPAIAGQVRYYSGNVPVPGVDVQLVNSGAPQDAVTDALGGFRLAAAPPGTLSLQPAKQGGANFAVTALDAAYVLQFVAGLRQFSGDQKIAADVTGNGSVSALDAARILQLQAGLLRRCSVTTTAACTADGDCPVGETCLSRFPVAEACGSDWAFRPVPSPTPNQTLVAAQISAGTCQPGAISYSSPVLPMSGQDFIAILFGDTTGNWTAP